MSDNEKKKSSGDKRFGDLFDKSDDEILSYRAKLLAVEEEKKLVEEETIEIIEFVLSYEKYGIESSYIKEVYAMKDFTTVPCTPDFVKGITSLRGEIISIVDIKKFFDLPDKGLTDLNRVLIANNGKMRMGILADRILGVKMVLNNDIKTDLKSIKNISSSYLKGITSDHLIILDIDKILTDPNFIVDQEVE